MKRDFRREAALLRVVAHHTRLAILDALSSGPKCVSDVRDLLDIPQPNLSQHLAVLRRAGIVDCYEKGKHHCYYIVRPSMAQALMLFLATECGEDNTAEKPRRRPAACSLDSR